MYIRWWDRKYLKKAALGIIDQFTSGSGFKHRSTYVKQ